MIRNSLCFSIISISLFPLISSDLYAADVEAGRVLSTRCAVCHGQEGEGNGVPGSKIAGMGIEHFKKCVEEYKNGVRRNVMMKRFTEDLDEEDIENLAAYYASREEASREEASSE